MKIGILGIQMPKNNDFDITNEFDLELINHLLGNNTGNMLFLNAILSFINTNNNSIENVNYNNHKLYYDCIIMPMANIIGYHTPDNSISDLIKFINKFDCEIIVIGMGSQIWYDELIVNINNNINLSDLLITFIKTISNRCNKIFIRCENTKKILNYYGIENVEVTGCPSILLNSNKELGKNIKNKIEYFKNNIDKIKLNLTYQLVYSNEFQKICTLSEMYNAPIIIQDDLEFMKEIFNKKKTIFDNNRFNLFYKIEDWLNFLNDYNTSIGLRIHGTIINIINENIGINICHDARTLGLCKILNIPYIEITNFLKQSDTNCLEYIINNIFFDENIFDNNRIIFAKKYKEEFEKYNIPLSEHLDNIIFKKINTKTFCLYKNLNDILKLPDDFKESEYKNLNTDLQYLSVSELRTHYLTNYHTENRKYKYENIPDDFDPKTYIELNEDLKNMNVLEAKNHYENQGYKENREYKYKNIP